METYIELLKKHDWTYDYSEDQTVWLRSVAERSTLTRLQQQLDKDLSVWNTYAPFDYRRVQ